MFYSDIVSLFRKCDIAIYLRYEVLKSFENIFKYISKLSHRRHEKNLICDT